MPSTVMTVLERTCMGIRYIHGASNIPKNSILYWDGWVKSSVRRKVPRVETQERTLENSIDPFARHPSIKYVSRGCLFVSSLVPPSPRGGKGKGAIMVSYKEVKGSMLVHKVLKLL